MKKIIGIIIFIGILSFFISQEKHETFPEIDFILIEKNKRQMSVYFKGNLLRTYNISLGFSPIGHKMQEGDGKTPEGIYFISHKIPNSQFHLALQISYPNKNDIRQAKEKRVSPGNNIMIHGLKNGLGWISKLHILKDWTLGCIAVTNKEIEEIYGATKVGTRIEIKP